MNVPDQIMEIVWIIHYQNISCNLILLYSQDQAVVVQNLAMVPDGLVPLYDDNVVRGRGGDFVSFTLGKQI